MERNLIGRVALVTGGSRGIGAAIARALAERGCDIAITYISSAKRADELTAELRSEGVRAQAYQSDQADPHAAAELVKDVVESYGRLDILVNNAGISSLQAVGAETDLDLLDKIWAINALGVIGTIRAAATIMEENGRIITIGSGAGTRTGLCGLADYSGSKAAVAGYSRGAAHDLAHRGITVNVVESGLMATELGEAIPEDIQKKLVSGLAIKRFGKLSEMAALVCFLASSDSSYITGATIPIDGGFSA